MIRPWPLSLEHPEVKQAARTAIAGIRKGIEEQAEIEKGRQEAAQRSTKVIYE
jgi:hypothetical protein